MKLKVGANSFLRSRGLSGVGLTVDAELIKDLCAYSRESEELLCATVWMGISLESNNSLSRMLEAICCEMDLWLIGLENHIAKLGGRDLLRIFTAIKPAKRRSNRSSTEVSAFIDQHERLARLSLSLADAAYNQGDLRIWEMMSGRSLFHERAVDLLSDVLMNEINQTTRPHLVGNESLASLG